MVTRPQRSKLSLGVTLVLLGAAACAHSSGTAAVNASDIDNPNSVDNSGRLPLPDSSANAPQAQQNDLGDPNSVMNKDRSPVLADKAAHDADLRAAEQGNPNSTDSSLPSPDAVLQRLHAFNRAAIAESTLGERMGGTSASAYASGVVREREIAEAQVSDVAHRLNVDLSQASDGRALQVMSDNHEAYQLLQRASGPEFDRMFAQQLVRDTRRDVNALKALRPRCVQPDLCALLDELAPVYQREDAGARSLRAEIGSSADNL